MKKDKIKIYTLEFLLIIILFFALFVSNIFSRVVLAIVLTIYAIVVSLFLKKRRILSVYQRQVMFLMIGFALIYLIIFYLMGLYFGYYEAIEKFSFNTFILYILPLSFIVISSEIVRNIFLSQKFKMTKFLTFVSMVLVDLIVYRSVYDITTLDGFLNIVGFTLFASIACNLLYNYISYRFGYKVLIVYRLITVLYVYIIPIIPDVYVFFRSFLRMLYPYIIYLVLEYSYSRNNFAVAYKDKRKNVIGFTFLTILMTGIIMLISCRFRYGILVIGSSSMTGAVNKGDAVVFESYRDQEIKNGQVIIFEDGKTKVVHRVIKIKKHNDQYIYFTKGDANSTIDDGYVTEDRILGVSKFKISYIGYPTLWVRDIFSKK